MLSVNVIYYFNWPFPTQAASEIENFEQFKMEKSPKKGSQEPFGKSRNCHIIYQQISHFPVCEEGAGVCAMLLTVISMIMIVISLPLSLFFVVKVVQVRQI